MTQFSLPNFDPKQKANTLAEFNKALKETAEKLLPQQVKLLQQKIALELLRRIVMKTPVDTGRARGNWQLTLKERAEGEVGEDILDATAAGTGEQAQDANAVRAAGTVIEGAAKVLRGLKPFSICYITNNVPYIVYLEEGSSKQAPQGMVALSLHEMLSMFQ
jgi:hypothetical protein